MIKSKHVCPQVRLVFDAFAASLNASTTKDSLLSRPVSLAKIELHGEDSSTGESAAASKRASDKAKALRKQAAQPMLQALEDVLDAKSTELSQICRCCAIFAAIIDSSLLTLSIVKILSPVDLICWPCPHV